MTSLYSLRSGEKPGDYTIMKFDPDYEVESVYALSAGECMCPAGHKPKCRHRTMLPLFLAHHHVDDGWFLDWDTRLWRHPVGEPAPAELADPLVLPSIATGSSEQEQPYGRSPAMAALPAIKAYEGATKPTPMMDTIRTLAAEEEPSPASPPAAAPAPAPEVTRSVGAGAPLKRRRITA